MYIALLLTIIIFPLFIKNRRRYVVIIGALLFVIACLRADTVGSDLTSYYSAYNMYRAKSIFDIFKFKYEPLFAILYLFVHWMQWSFRLFLIICAGLTLVGPIFFIKKYSKLPWLSYFLYVSGTYYFSTLSMLRGCIGMSISMFSIDAIIERRYKKAFFFAIIACLFHYSAAIIPLFAFFFLCNNSKYTVGVSGLIVVSSVLIRHIFSGIFATLYLSSYGSIFKNQVSGTGYSMLLILVILWNLGIFFSRYKTSQLYKAYDALILSAIVCQIVATSVSLFSRETRYFIIPALIIAPSVLLSYLDTDSNNGEMEESFDLLNESNNYLVLFILMALFFAVFIKYVTGEDSTGVLPYAVAQMEDLKLWKN